MSSDYYGGIAGDLADQGSVDQQAFLKWMDEFCRWPNTLPDSFAELSAAFHAGAEYVRTGEVPDPPNHPDEEEKIRDRPHP